MLDGVNQTPSTDMSQVSAKEGQTRLTVTGVPIHNRLVEEADNSQENEELVFEEHGDTHKDSYANNGVVKMLLKPISPLAASATVVNLLLATGPFS